jgi:DNA helicase-2/ATP-dependent DNA helicase PcrA
MSTSEADQILANEQSAEKQYNEALAERASKAQSLANSQIQNTWTTSVSVGFERSGKLIGRVRLVEESELLEGDQFYLGTAHGKTDGVPVYSIWAPLFGDAFYLGGRIEHLGDIHAVRTLDRADQGRISFFEDQILSENPPAPLFPRPKLLIENPPQRFETVIVGTPTEDRPEKSVATAHTEPAPAAQGDGPRDSDPHAEGTLTSRRPSARLGLRAEPILLHKLASPKRGDMAPVLATLQPDQYRAITRPATESVIFQGHPGTGKTVIAVHRLAYLTSPAAETRRANGLVMLVGPTREYAEHVRPAVRALVGEDDDYVVVKSLPELLEEFAGVQFDRQTDTRVEDGTFVSDDMLTYLRATFNAVKKEGGMDGADRSTAVRAAYERLRTSPAFPDGDAMDGGWYRFLRALPEFEEVAKSPQMRPLLAYFGIRYRTPFIFSDVAHIIVDESQDVHPLEWEILGRMGASQGWSILGDLNQRRSELTYRSWKPVAFALSIDEEGKAPIVALERGYRSTGPIMRFANRLLHRAERALNSLQADGPEPMRVRAPQRDKLVPVAIEQATLLCGRHPDGSVAIIAAETSQLRSGLRRTGWSANSGDAEVWTSSGGTIRLLSHDQARGLEFDAVVVVEPAAFPSVEGEGRFGSLYTSLTRANKELVVVNHRALPDALRG